MRLSMMERQSICSMVNNNLPTSYTKIEFSVQPVRVRFGLDCNRSQNKLKIYLFIWNFRFK